jgi:hypothetical protein
MRIFTKIKQRNVKSVLTAIFVTTFDINYDGGFANANFLSSQTLDAGNA